MVGKDADIISTFLNLLRLTLCPACDQSWRMFHAHLRRMCILLLLDGMLYKYQLSASGLICHFKACVFLLIFCVDDLSIDVGVGC